MKNLEGSITVQESISSAYDKDGNAIYQKKGEVNSGEIKTIQNDSYSIKELHEKFTTGVMNAKAVMRSGEEFEYSDHEFMNSELPEIVDMVDLENYQTTLNAKITTMKKAISEKKKAIEEAAKAEAVAKAKEELATEKAKAEASKGAAS